VFSTTPILWLQAWASPPLTMAMNIVSLFGYVPSALAIAAIYAMGWRQRRGVMVMVAVLLAALVADAAKSTFRMPRPHEVDKRVMALSLLQPGSADYQAGAAGTTQDTHGFPSGHVAVAAALTLAFCLLLRRTGVFTLAAIWIALTAVSRLYLGRHFAGDTAGGLLAGVIGVIAAWKLFGASISRAPEGRLAPVRPALALLALAVAAVVMSTSFLDPIGAGRFVGIAGAVLTIDWLDGFDDPSSRVTRIGGILLALAAIALTVWWVPAGTRVDTVLRIHEFAAATVLSSAVLLVPVLALRVRRPS
jgi:membrane-associated phospholipid phosphatase